MTKEDAVKIYKKCGKFLHEDNPYATPHDTSYYENNIPIWNSRIVSLLARHLVHIHQDEMYYVGMKSAKDGRAFVNVFKRVE